MNKKVDFLAISFIAILIAFTFYSSKINLFDFFDTNFYFVLYNCCRDTTEPTDKIRMVKINEVVAPEKQSELEGKMLNSYGFHYRKFHKDVLKNIVDAGAKVITFDYYFLETKEDDPQKDVINFSTKEMVKGLKYAKSKGVKVFTTLPPHNEMKNINKEVRENITGLIHPYVETKDLTGIKVKTRLNDEWAFSVRVAAAYLDKTPEEIASKYGDEIYTNFTHYSKEEQKQRMQEGKRPLLIEDDEIAFKSYDYSSVYFGNFPKEEFKDKIVLIGNFLRHHQNKYDDYFVSPLDYPPQKTPFFNIPGVLFQAHAINTIIQDKPIHVPSALTIILISILLMLLTFILLRYLESSIIAGISALGIFLIFLFGSYFLAHHNVILKPSLPIVSFLLSIMFAMFVRIILQSEKLKIAHANLAIEKDKSEKLLLNILPKEIADELKEKGGSYPREYQLVTILFTDFKGFTMLAEKLSPQELVSELDKCFEYFDQTVEDNHLEKIKTIGDAYMCAGGLPTPNKTSPIDSVLAGLEMVRFIERTKKLKEKEGIPYWEMRVGINSGVLMAGVVGKSKFAYDVWGDTVNTASRMESSGVPQRVNISSSTYELVKDFFDCTHRGKIKAKNKGEIDMYLVEGIKPELSVDGLGVTPNDKFKSLYNNINYLSSEQQSNK